MDSGSFVATWTHVALVWPELQDQSARLEYLVQPTHQLQVLEAEPARGWMWRARGSIVPHTPRFPHLHCLLRGHYLLRPLGSDCWAAPSPISAPPQANQRGRSPLVRRSRLMVRL
jgi:hypothetical protein